MTDNLVPSQDLLPCPFCGGEANFQEEHANHWRVVCMSCGVRHTALVVREADPRPKLVAAWNTRADLAASRSPVQSSELVEKLTKALPILDGLETGRDCEEYAFAKGNGFQAMTYCPEAFEALRCLPDVIAAFSPSSLPQSGVVPAEDEISDAIQAWHDSGTDLELHDWLGWTADEYAGWVRDDGIPARPLRAALSSPQPITDQGEA